MSQPGVKKHVIYLLIGGIILFYPCSLLLSAEKGEKTGQIQISEEELPPPSHLLLGKIDRVGDNELVIDDSLYPLSAEGGVRAGSFREGQTVTGELNDKRQIISLQILRKAASKVATARQENPVNDFSRLSTTQQPLYQEDGVWKN